MDHRRRPRAAKSSTQERAGQRRWPNRATAIAGFSTGKTFGDGRQASHWKDSLGLGLMDPTAGTGELLFIGANDVLAFDVIGYDRVPEPAAPELVAVAVSLFVAFVARRRRG